MRPWPLPLRSERSRRRPPENFASGENWPLAASRSSSLLKTSTLTVGLGSSLSDTVRLRPASLRLWSLPARGQMVAIGHGSSQLTEGGFVSGCALARGAARRARESVRVTMAIRAHVFFKRDLRLVWGVYRS